MRAEPSGYRLLFLLPFPPRLDADHGGAGTIGALLHHLPRRHEVAALFLQSEGDLPPDEAMHARCSHLVGIDRPAGTGGGTAGRAVRQAAGLISGRPPWATRWRVARFAEEARRLAAAWRPHLIQAEFSIMGQYLGALGELGIPRVLTVHEPGVVASAHRRAMTAGPRRAWASVEHRVWAAYERRIMGFAEAVVAFTEGDLAALRALGGSGQDTRFARIPFGVTVPDRLPEDLPEDLPVDLPDDLPHDLPDDLPGAAPDPRSSGRCRNSPLLLFVGNYRHPPNVDAARRLVHEILPAVRREVPGARLRLVGPNLPPGLVPRGAVGVEVTGHVPELGPHVREAAVVVAPLRMGGGMRVKVLEAMAAGRPLVATRLAVAGLDVGGGEQVLLGESDREIVGAVVHLLEHPEEADALGRAARAWVARHATWAQAAAGYEDLYRSLL